MYAKSLSNTYKNIFIQIRGSNPVAEQLSGLNLLIQYIQKKATCIYVHGRANIIFSKRLLMKQKINYLI